MKNTLKKVVLGTLIAATAATTAIVPTAATVMASDCVYVDIDDDDDSVMYCDDENLNFHLTQAELDDIYTDEDEVVYVDDEDDLDEVYVEVEEPVVVYEYVEVETKQPVKKTSTKTVSLDKTHAGEIRYANVDDFLALRSRATSDSKMIAELAPNTKMVIIGTAGDWVKVYVPSVDSDGFVYNKYISSTMR